MIKLALASAYWFGDRFVSDVCFRWQTVHDGIEHPSL